ncbi:hypothetical protein BWI17_01050 [Betaproteobacteria bacterium GR16-43]|nr:hypothetical protein BWI17_01050 [Betaproteobacteria bacterium GR16-43]
MPATDADDRQLLRDTLVNAWDFTAAFESRDALRALGEALRLARRLGDARSEAQVLALATQCHYQRGDYVSAVANGLDACATYGRNDLEGRCHAFAGVALAFFSVREFKRAEESARRAIRFATRERESLAEAQARSTLAFILADTGRFEEALSELRRARLRYRKAGDLLRLKKASSNAGHTWRKWGDALAREDDPEGARRCWQRAMRYYRAAFAGQRSRLDDVIILGCLGECALRLGLVPEAAAHLSAAGERLKPKDPTPILATFYLLRGEVEQAQQRWSWAERHLKTALAESDSLENDEVSVGARAALARLYEAQGDAARARQWKAEAKRVAEEQDESLSGFRRQMRPLWDRFLRAAED